MLNFSISFDFVFRKIINCQTATGFGIPVKLLEIVFGSAQSNTRNQKYL